MLVLGLLTNMGALAICALAITYYASLTRSPAFVINSLKHPNPSFCLILGLIFGLTAAFLIVLSTKVSEGAVVDLRAAPAILSGVFGGPIAAAVTLLLGAVARIYVGGPWAIGGALSVLIYVASGLLFPYLYRNLFRREFDLLGILLLSVLATLAVIPCLWAYVGYEQGMVLASAILPILLVNNPLGVLLLGTALMVTLRIVNDRERLSVVSGDLEKRIAAERQSNEKLQDTVGELENLIHTVSHDLRGPLITLRGFLDLMEEARTSDDQVSFEHARSRVARSAEAMDSIVISVLDHNRLSQTEIITEDTSVQKIFEEVADTLGFSMRGPGPIARFEGPDRVIRAEVAALRQVILNSVLNAAKHGGRAEALVVHASVNRQAGPDGHFYDVVTISDNGKTIPEEHQRDVFRRFRRLSRNDEGSGLGLAIIEKIANLHGGKAWITDSTLGGTSIHIGFSAVRSLSKTA